MKTTNDLLLCGANMSQWKTREIDAAYLLDSGILFEINRSFLHQLGIAMVAKKDESGKLVLALKDSRETPEALSFNQEVYVKGNMKLRRYMQDFGHSQMKRRDKLLGWSSQSWFVPDDKRYKI